MKKIISVLVLFIFLVCFNGLVLAAGDPFADVPAKHWAYGAIAKLAKDGIINGYGDGTFRGDRVMTRYEIAQIVANASTKAEKANAEDKALIVLLKNEFSDELKNLNVRVSDIKRKMDNLNRFRYVGNMKLGFVTDNPGPNFTNKNRGSKKLFYHNQNIFTYDVNEKTHWMAYYETQGTRNAGTSAVYNTGTLLLRLDDVAGFDTVFIGKQPIWGLGPGLINRPMDADAIFVNKKINASLFFDAYVGNIKNPVANPTSLQANPVLQMAQITKVVNPNLTISVGGYGTTINSQGNGAVNFTTGTYNKSSGVDVSVVAKISKEWTLMGEYIDTRLRNVQGKLPSNPKAWGVQLSNSPLKRNPALFYGIWPTIVDVKKPGQSAFAILYFSYGPGSVPPGSVNYDGLNNTAATTPNGKISLSTADNTKNLWLVYQKCIAKDLAMTIQYMDVKINNQSVTPLTDKQMDRITQLWFRWFW